MTDMRLALNRISEAHAVYSQILSEIKELNRQQLDALLLMRDRSSAHDQYTRDNVEAIKKDYTVKFDNLKGLIEKVILPLLVILGAFVGLKLQNII